MKSKTQCSADRVFCELKLRHDIGNGRRFKCIYSWEVFASSEVLKAVKLLLLFFWVVRPCERVDRHRRFRGTYWFCLQPCGQLHVPAALPLGKSLRYAYDIRFCASKGKWKSASCPITWQMKSNFILKNVWNYWLRSVEDCFTRHCKEPTHWHSVVWMHISALTASQSAVCLSELELWPCLQQP